MTDTPLTVTQEGPVRRLVLNRPNRRNALSRTLVNALYDQIASIQEGGGTRIVVLSGAGPVFCAGADLSEFVEASDEDQVRADAEGLSRLLAALVRCPVPIVAQVHGAAFGGGVGLVCAADIAIAATGTRFSLSEARLGIIPAVISPYVFAALGLREATARMLLAEPYGVDVALRQGLIQHAVSEADLAAAVDAHVDSLLRGAPGALAAIKRLPDLYLPERAGTDLQDRLNQILFERRRGEEGQEGMRAFLEKRPPRWAPDGERDR